MVMKKIHYIYKITRTDGAFYIGRHSTNKLEDGYFGSGVYLKRSIKKHGKAAHSIQILEFLTSSESVKAREKELVSPDLLKNPLCMNMAIDGEGGGRTGLVPVKKGNLVKMVLKEEFYSNRHMYTAVNQGMVPVIDCNGDRRLVRRQEFLSNPDLNHVCSGMVLVQGAESGQWVTKEEFQTGKYVGINKGRISVAANPMAKYILIYDAKGTNRFVCQGNFKTVCKANGLPHNALRISHTRGGEPIFQSSRQIAYAAKNGLEMFAGWYAKGDPLARRAPLRHHARLRLHREAAGL